MLFPKSCRMVAAGEPGDGTPEVPVTTLPLCAPLLSAPPMALRTELVALADTLEGQVKHWPEQPFVPQPNPHVYSPFSPHFFSQ